MNKHAMAAIIKVRVAAIERLENRAMPAIPCPLVQPLPIDVPKPTNKPPMIKSGRLLSGADGKGRCDTRWNNCVPAIMATKKVMRHRLLRKLVAINEKAMPQMPAMRPLKANSNVAERPMAIPPPKTEDQATWSNNESILVLPY